MCFYNFIADNWQTLITLFFAIIGGGFALLQWKKNVNIKQAEFFNQIIEKLNCDSDVVQTMYMITYGKEQWYDCKGTQHFLVDKKTEDLIDKSLHHLDYVCYLREKNLIDEKGFYIFEYEINRCCKSIQTQTYLFNLYKFSEKQNAKCGFQNLINYAIKKKLFDKDFMKNTDRYTKTLNW